MLDFLRGMGCLIYRYGILYSIVFEWGYILEFLGVVVQDILLYLIRDDVFFKFFLVKDRVWSIKN